MISFTYLILFLKFFVTSCSCGEVYGCVNQATKKFEGLVGTYWFFQKHSMHNLTRHIASLSFNCNIGDLLHIFEEQMANRVVMCHSCVLHCEVASALWIAIFSRFGLSWVMLNSMADLFSCWWSGSRSLSVVVWTMVPLCIMWTLWREINDRNF